MKHACELGVGINRTYIQPVVCKSPTTTEASSEDESPPDKLIEQVIRTSLYDLHRNTQKTIIHTLLYRHNTRHKKGGFIFSARNCLSVFHFKKLIHYFQHSYIQHTLHSIGFFHNISVKQNVSTTGGIRTTVTPKLNHRLVTIHNLMFLALVYCNIIIQYKPKK